MSSCHAPIIALALSNASSTAPSFCDARDEEATTPSRTLAPTPTEDFKQPRLRDRMREDEEEIDLQGIRLSMVNVPCHNVQGTLLFQQFLSAPLRASVSETEQ